MEKDIMTFQLSEKIDYAKGGDWLKTATFELSPPGPSEFGEACDLAQLVMGAMLEASRFTDQIKQEDTKSQDLELDGNAVKAMLLSSQDIKFKDVVKQFEALAIKVGTTDGAVKLTHSILEKLNVSDRMRLCCEYVANFTIPSLNLGEG